MNGTPKQVEWADKIVAQARLGVESPYRDIVLRGLDRIDDAAIIINERSNLTPVAFAAGIGLLHPAFATSGMAFVRTVARDIMTALCHRDEAAAEGETFPVETLADVIVGESYRRLVQAASWSAADVARQLVAAGFPEGDSQHVAVLVAPTQESSHV